MSKKNAAAGEKNLERHVATEGGGRVLPMPAWVAIIVVARELAITSLRLIAVESGKVIAAAWSGKIKTAATMVCFCLMMLPIPDALVTACWIVVVLTTVYSGVEYFIKNAEVFR